MENLCYNPQMNKNKITTKEKIVKAAISLFNSNDTLSVTTNHIAKEAGISPGNLYYHFKNKNEIICQIYQHMHENAESFNLFELVMTGNNPLKILNEMYDMYGKLFWEFRFLMRDMPVLIAIDKDLKKMFAANQERRMAQISGLFKFLIVEEVIQGISLEEIGLRSRHIWFISAYWHVFTSTFEKMKKEHIEEAKEMVFRLHIIPYLTPKGKELLNEGTPFKV